MKRDAVKGTVGLAAAVVLLVSSVPSFAATVSVRAAYDALQGAINTAAPGDTILIEAGTCVIPSGSLIYVMNKSDLTLRGAGQGDTVIRNSADNTLPGVYIDGSTGIAVENLSIAGGKVAMVVTSQDTGVASSMTLRSVTLKETVNVGLFVGMPGCQPDSPGHWGRQECYSHPEDYVDASRVEIYESTVQDTGVYGRSGTGIVFFPGTTGLISDSAVNRAQYTGVFMWGSRVDIEGSTFDQNVEHAVEYRVFPSPIYKTGLILRAAGTLSGNVLRRGRKRPEGTLGGGVVTQGSDVVLTGNTIEANQAWGICADNGSNLTLNGNIIRDNGQASLVVKKKSRANLSGDRLTGNGFEGVVAVSGSFADVRGAEIRNNGKYGVLAQKASEVHVTDCTLDGNGTRGTATVPYGGAAFSAKSWGSVVRSHIVNHQHGAGIIHFGGSREVFVEENTIADNRASGVVFYGRTATGTALRNSYSGNSPLDVDCPNGGRPFLSGEQIGTLSVSCADPGNQFVTVAPGSVMELPLSTVWDEAAFSVQISSSVPAAVGRTINDDGGTTGLAASLQKGKKLYLAGGRTDGAETTLVIHNSSGDQAAVTVTFYPEGAAERTASYTIPPWKRTVITASTVVGGGRRFSALISSRVLLVAEQRVTLAGGGAYAVPALAAAASSWSFARGQAGNGTTSLLSVHNPAAQAALLDLTYLTGDGSRVTASRTVGPRSQVTVDAAEDLVGAAANFALLVTSDQPVIASLAVSGPQGAEGYAGAPGAGTSWYLPRGTVEDGAGTTVHLANADGQNGAAVTVTFQTEDGLQTTAEVALGPGEVVDLDAAQYVSGGAFGTMVSSDRPVAAAERVVRAAGDASGDSGLCAPLFRAYLADGSTVGSRETTLILHNPGDVAATFRLLPYTAAE